MALSEPIQQALVKCSTHNFAIFSVIVHLGA